MKKYIVTGGAGFIGSNLTDYLIDRGDKVVVLDSLFCGKRENVNPKAKFINADLCGCKQGSASMSSYLKLVQQEIDGASGIFHMAAMARVQPSIKDPCKSNDINVGGTLNVLNIARNLGIKRVVYSASSSAYGNASVYPTPEDAPTDPLSPYGLQKQIGEQYCRVFYHCYGLESVSLRYFNVFGERQSLDGAYQLVMGIFAKQLLEGKPMTITGDGEQRRDFTYVGDVVKANVLAMESPNVGKGEVINIGNGESRSVNQLADLMGGPRVYIDPVIEPRETLADNTKAKKLLGWEPETTIEDWIPKYKKALGL
jgi:UDP-glucose 4-epimerase|tara:strand:- start:10084 stop:11019 length:936 start_codon:yes stop_codon:yes gene_type:complete